MQKLNWILCLCGLLLVLGTKQNSVGAAAAGENKDYGDADYADDEDDGDADDVDISKLNPVIRDIAQLHSPEAGGKVDFLCRGDDLEHYTILWKRIRTNDPERKEEYLNTGVIMVTQDKRFTIGDKQTILTLNNVKPSDDGIYTCMVAGDPRNISLSHTLRVRGGDQQAQPVHPTVYTHPRIVVGAGNSTTLTCNASGTPEPKVYWEKKNDRMPNGQLFMEGRSITFQIVSRRHAGIYECLANNSVGTARTALNLSVIFAPEIEVEYDSRNAALKSDVELKCVVYGEPKPHVHWIKDSNSLSLRSLSGKYHQIHKGDEHILHINDIQKMDYGNYACVANNTQGIRTQMIELSGNPSQPTLTASGVGEDGRSYKLVYRIESAAAITEFRLKYKKVGENDVEVPVEGKLSEGSTNVYTVDHTLKDLESSTDYEVTLSASNEFGSSKEARPRRFHINGGSSSASTLTPLFLASIFLFLPLLRITWQ